MNNWKYESLNSLKICVNINTLKYPFIRKINERRDFLFPQHSVIHHFLLPITDPDDPSAPFLHYSFSFGMKESKRRTTHSLIQQIVRQLCTANVPEWCMNINILFGAQGRTHIWKTYRRSYCFSPFPLSAWLIYFWTFLSDRKAFVFTLLNL